MNLNKEDLLQLAQLAILAATKAGKIITEHSNKQIAVKNKRAGTSKASQVVTEVDLLSQKAILNLLEPTLKKYNLGLVTEESTDDHSRFENNFFWCIDPLDGTLPFIEGVSGYSVSIALVSRSGIPHIGVIYNPVEDTLYYAIKGEGVLRNNKPWNLSKENELQPLTFVTDRSFINHPQYEIVVTQLKKLANEMGCGSLNIINIGGAAMNACWVLENNPACYFKFPKETNGGGSIWDFAASACIFNEIGAFAKNIYGEQLKLNRADSTFMNHQGVLYASNKELAQQITNLYSSLNKT